MTTSKLQLTLLQNGLDFVREGVEALYGLDERPKPKAYKYAILHIFSGTLLLLKERLKRAHPSLIAKDVGLKLSAEAKTVDFDEVLRRLESAADVVFSKDDSGVLRKAQRLRNTMEHSEVELEVAHVNALVGELIEFLERFLREQLQESIFQHVSAAAGGEVAELAKIAERLRLQRREEWRARASKYFDLSDRKLKKMASDASRSSGYDTEEPYIECPQCWKDSMLMVERDIGVCTNRECKDVAWLHECPRCGGVSFSEESYCRNCANELAWQIAKDD